MESQELKINELSLSIEEVKALYFNEETLLTRPVSLFRIDGSGLRYYYTLVPNEEDDLIPFFYVSVTSIIEATVPKSPYLIQWLIDQEGEGWKIAEERAEYGTFMHIILEKVLFAWMEKSEFDLSSLHISVLEYIESIEIEKTPRVKQWEKEIKQDVLSFVQFLIDYNVKPIAMELGLKSDKYGTGGRLDLPCTLTIQEKGFHGEKYLRNSGDNKKGDPKESKGPVEYTAIVDFKSGRKGVYYESEVQLAFYGEMFKENFPEYKETELKLFNWRPKDWRSEPGYVLTDQTGKHCTRYLELLSEEYQIKNDIGSIKRTIVSGKIDFMNPLTDNYSKFTLAEIASGYNKKLEDEGEN